MVVAAVSIPAAADLLREKQKQTASIASITLIVVAITAAADTDIIA